MMTKYILNAVITLALGATVTLALAVLMVVV